MSKPTIRRITDLSPSERIARNIYRSELSRIETLADIPKCKRPVWISLLCLFGIVLMIQGCKSEQQERKEMQELMEKSLSISTYNYTKYEIYAPHLMAKNETNIENAAWADSVFFNTSGFKSLSSDVSVSFSSGGCCFVWDKSTKHEKIRVVWSVVYDHAKFEGVESKGYDDRKSKEPQPGRACKKICVNDILPMTFKGNYHGHKQQVCKRLSAITY